MEAVSLFRASLTPVTTLCLQGLQYKVRLMQLALLVVMTTTTLLTMSTVKERVTLTMAATALPGPESSVATPRTSQRGH